MIRAAALAASFLPAFALAGCPDGEWWSTEREFKQSGAVVIAKPVRKIADRGASGWIAGDFYKLEVETVLSGDPSLARQVFSEDSSGRFPMEIGKQYLLLVSRCDGRSFVYARGNSARLAEAQATLSEIERLASPVQRRKAR